MQIGPPFRVAPLPQPAATRSGRVRGCALRQLVALFDAVVLYKRVLCIATFAPNDATA